MMMGIASGMESIESGGLEEGRRGESLLFKLCWRFQHTLNSLSSLFGLFGFELRHPQNLP